MVLVCLVAAALGMLMAGRWLRFGEPPTPLARVGRALAENPLPGGRWGALRDDLEAVRQTFVGESGVVLDLVAALRGFGNDGNPEWATAEQRCRALKWPRCDRPALEEMTRRIRLSDTERKDLASAPRFAMANLVWAFGSEASVRAMIRTEIDRLPDSDGPHRARVFLRFGIIDTNFDGQAALFNQACVADPTICDRERMKGAAQREVRARFVSPGNLLPLYFTGGHPSLTGAN